MVDLRCLLICTPSCGTVVDPIREANRQEAQRVESLARLKSEIESALKELPFVKDARVALGQTAAGRTVVAEVVPGGEAVTERQARAKVTGIAARLALVSPASVRVFFVSSLK